MNENKTSAHCRNCDLWGARSDVTDKHDPNRDGSIYDRCKACGSIDVDIMSPEGAAHEFDCEVLA